MIRSLLTLLTLTACELPSAFSDAPLAAYELDGQWCTLDSKATCLTVTGVQRTGLAFSTYQWSSPTCNEQGTLTDGLTFKPDIGPLCMTDTYAPYDATGDWTETGISLELAIGTLELEWSK